MTKSIHFMPGCAPATRYDIFLRQVHHPVEDLNFNPGSQKWQRKMRRRAHAAGVKNAFRR